MQHVFNHINKKFYKNVRPQPSSLYRFVCDDKPEFLTILTIIFYEQNINNLSHLKLLCSHRRRSKS
jgi:hypothetical protein